RIDGVADSSVPMPPSADRILDCTTEAALVEEGGMPVVYQRCNATRCDVALRGGAYSFGRAAMLDDGTAVYAASRGRLIALWREGAADAEYFRLPSPVSLHALVVWDGVPY